MQYVNDFNSFRKLNENNAQDDKFNYMMLSRLQSDCEYFLNYGHGSVRNLWGDDVERHIGEMKRLWNQLPIKPEWLSYEKIEEYEKDMLNYNKQIQNESVSDMQNGLAKKALNRIYRFGDGDMSWKDRIDRGDVTKVIERDGKYEAYDGETYYNVPKAVYDYFKLKSNKKTTVDTNEDDTDNVKVNVSIKDIIKMKKFIIDEFGIDEDEISEDDVKEYISDDIGVGNTTFNDLPNKKYFPKSYNFYIKTVFDMLKNTSIFEKKQQQQR